MIYNNNLSHISINSQSDNNSDGDMINKAFWSANTHQTKNSLKEGTDIYFGYQP